MTQMLLIIFLWVNQSFYVWFSTGSTQGVLLTSSESETNALDTVDAVNICMKCLNVLHLEKTFTTVVAKYFCNSSLSICKPFDRRSCTNCLLVQSPLKALWFHKSILDIYYISGSTTGLLTTSRGSTDNWGSASSDLSSSPAFHSHLRITNEELSKSQR